MRFNERRIAIWNTLCSRRSATINELAREFHVSPRTIQYDVEFLSLIHPIETVRGRHGGCIKIPDGFNPKPHQVTTIQLDFLISLLSKLDEEDRQMLMTIIYILQA